MTQFGCSPEDRPSPPTDDPFLERLFGLMCESISMPKAGTFIDQVRRWYDVLRFMADLEPRTNTERLLAADVSMKYEFMQDVLARGRGHAGRQRQQRSSEFQSCAQEYQTAQLVYETERSKLPD